MPRSMKFGAAEKRLREWEAALVEVEAAYHKMVDRQKARDEFLAASVRVWREIDRLSAEPNGYKGIETSNELRVRERKAWERYRETIA